MVDEAESQSGAQSRSRISLPTGRQVFHDPCNLWPCAEASDSWNHFNPRFVAQAGAGRETSEKENYEVSLRFCIIVMVGGYKTDCLRSSEFFGPHAGAVRFTKIGQFRVRPPTGVLPISSKTYPMD